PAMRRLLILAAWGALLGVLWFAVPLMLWPSRTTKKTTPEPLPASTPAPVAKLPTGADVSSLAESAIRYEPGGRLASLAPSPDQSLMDSRGQESLVPKWDKGSTTDLPGETRVTPFLANTVPPVAAGPDATVILDRLPNKDKPGQTQ